MVITELLERNARFYGSETALVEINPSEKRDSCLNWREQSLVVEAEQGTPYRRAITWREFNRMANRIANLILSRGYQKGTKVGILMMNCIEFLPVYFGVLKAGMIVVPMNYRYASDEILYCLKLADVEMLFFGPEFTDRLSSVYKDAELLKTRFFVGKNSPEFAEDLLSLINYMATDDPPVSLTLDDYAAIYFSSGTTGFPKAILHKHRSLYNSCLTEQNHHQ